MTAARRAEELIALLERRGATVVHAPAMRTVPLADDGELPSTTRALVERAPDMVIATTAVGFRGWAEAADGWGLGDALLDRFRGAELLARGPKVRGAVRAAGLTEDWSPASESMAEVLDRLLATGVAGSRIAVQLHGEPLTEFVAALRDAGADVAGVPSTGGCRPRTRARSTGWSTPRSPVRWTRSPSPARPRPPACFTGPTSVPCGTPWWTRCAGTCWRPASARSPRGRWPRTRCPRRRPSGFRLGPLAQLLCQELPARAPVLRVGSHGVAVLGRVALVDGEPRAVTPAQAALVRALARRPGRVVTPAELSRALPDPAAGEDAVGAVVAELDAALGVPGLVEAVADRRYRLAAPEPGPDDGARLGEA